MQKEWFDRVTVRSTQDLTLRWSCRQGDYLLWLRFSIWDEAAVKVMDVWEPSDGALVTATNRPADFPLWFDLHPFEVQGQLASWLMRRLEQGYEPADPIEGPNIWRPKGGDRIVWVGADRPGQPAIEGVLAILDCRDAMAVLGDHPSEGALAFMEFHGTQAAVAPCRRGLAAAKSLGPPRTHQPDWQLG